MSATKLKKVWDAQDKTYKSEISTSNLQGLCYYFRENLTHKYFEYVQNLHNKTASFCDPHKSTTGMFRHF